MDSSLHIFKQFTPPMSASVEDFTSLIQCAAISVIHYEVFFLQTDSTLLGQGVEVCPPVLYSPLLNGPK